jgi:predicted DNA repair protein MutK
MATSLLALLDDITTILDDVAVMSKMAVKKTTGVMGDDLALNAQQVAGVNADRELPVIWAVFKGSFFNKLILVPLALLISAFVPALITPLLMAGGLFLCYEGVEKVLHKWLQNGKTEHAPPEPSRQAVAATGVQTEKDKIKGAVRTDFILSAEIVVITLGSIAAGTPWMQRVLVLSLIALGMTIGVYGLVAGIVKLDDLGVVLFRKGGGARTLGEWLLRAVPWLMRGLSVAGTLAMFLVGGGILAHGIAPLVHWLHGVELSWGGLLGSLAASLTNLLIGFASGAIVLAVVHLARKLRGKQDDTPTAA